MAASTRTTQFTRLHKILKRYYHPVLPDPNRSVLEHLLFASCLENAHYRVAEEMFASLVHTFFDWNEIRVSSVRELSEVVSGLPDPAAAGHRVKRILQNLFEATYSFDLEELRKQNLGPAVERLEKMDGTTKFSIAYVVQAALGGHAIPIDSGTASALHLVDLASDADVAEGVIPGLDRAIPKTSGLEFGSLLHQLGADYTASPYSPAFHAILLEIDPSAKPRLPSRRGPKRPVPEAPAAHDASDAKTAKDAPDAKAARSKPGKAGHGDAKKEPAGTHEAGPGPTAAVAKDTGQEVPPETKKKPMPTKRKAAAGETPAEATAPVPDELPRKKDQEPIEDAVAAEKRKQAFPPKKTPPKKKADESKGKNPSEPGREAEGLEGISKRKPR